MKVGVNKRRRRHYRHKRNKHRGRYWFTLAEVLELCVPGQGWAGFEATFNKVDYSLLHLFLVPSAIVTESERSTATEVAIMERTRFDPLPPCPRFLP